MAYVLRTVTACPPTVLYSDTSTGFGIGGVLLLPAERVTLFFRTHALGERIDFLEVKAAAVANTVFVSWIPVCPKIGVIPNT